MTITRSSVQTPTHKDFGHNGQSSAIASKGTYTPMSPGLTPAQQ
ncbi:acetyltransferase [Lacticaseibacillus paracasei]|nr:acetyltransferase [Lacticaseibacillus paracasei]